MVQGGAAARGAKSLDKRFNQWKKQERDTRRQEVMKKEDRDTRRQEVMAQAQAQFEHTVVEKNWYTDAANCQTDDVPCLRREVYADSPHQAIRLYTCSNAPAHTGM